jgi:uncharacterized protein (TIGR00297 family)
MTLADSAGLALAVTAVLAVAARLAGALTTGGAVAGAVVGACVSLGFGLPGLAVLGTFFVVGTLATRIGWERKKTRGTAEAGEGRRDARRVLGKGGVAAGCALFAVLTGNEGLWHLAFCGAVAAALADTLGTEIGTLSTASPRTLPSLRSVVAGTPGAVSLAGTAGAALGGAIVGAASAIARDGARDVGYLLSATALFGLSGLAASLIESVAVGLGLRAPGFVRNVLTTLAGAALTTFALFLLWDGSGLPKQQ